MERRYFKNYKKDTYKSILNGNVIKGEALQQLNHLSSIRFTTIELIGSGIGKSDWWGLKQFIKVNYIGKGNSSQHIQRFLEEIAFCTSWDFGILGYSLLEKIDDYINGDCSEETLDFHFQLETGLISKDSNFKESNNNITKPKNKLASKKNQAITNLKQGNIEYRNGNFNEAINYYNKAIEIDSNFKEARDNRNKAKNKLASKKNKAITNLKQGNIEYKNGNFNEAINYYNKAIEIDSNFKEARDNRDKAKNKLNYLDTLNYYLDRVNSYYEKLEKKYGYWKILIFIFVIAFILTFLFGQILGL